MLNFFKKKPTNYKNIGQEDFDKLRKRSDCVVLDVRSSAEVKEGSVRSYILHNFLSANFKSEIVKLDTTKTYLVYCRSSNRSRKACAMMGELGFDQLYNLEGGIVAWNSYSRK